MRKKSVKGCCGEQPFEKMPERKRTELSAPYRVLAPTSSVGIVVLAWKGFGADCSLQPAGVHQSPRLFRRTRGRVWVGRKLSPTMMIAIVVTATAIARMYLSIAGISWGHCL